MTSIGATIADFQSTLLQEERPSTSNVRMMPCPFFQSTLLQEERPEDTYRIVNAINLSIHAPTRGATLSFLLLFWNPLSFNPRSYKRSDSEDQKRMITIYTFNPRSYKRSDKGQTSMFALIFFFQSTLLQEERLCKRVCIFNVSTFNPRSYKRSDKQSA